MISLFFSNSRISPIFTFFFFNDTATTEIYTLSLHDALPIYPHFTQDVRVVPAGSQKVAAKTPRAPREQKSEVRGRSEEHTSELQSRSDLVCRLLLEKKKKKRQKSEGPHKK